MEENRQQIFRKEALERISSPEQLTDYLRVTNPGIWVILAAVLLLMAGIFAWSMVGTLETKADVRVVVTDHTAQVISLGQETIVEGMELRIGDEAYEIAAVGTDEYGRQTGTAEAALPDGIYDGVLITEKVHPISFLKESR